jgi:hypothetical protein
MRKNKKKTGYLRQALTLRDYTGVWEYLRQGASPNDVLEEAVQRGDERVIKRLIATGANEEHILELAAMTKNFGMVETMLSMGSIPDGQGTTCVPLVEDIEAGQKDVTDLLIKRGADVNLMARPSRKDKKGS